MVLAEISPSEGCQDSHITVRYNQLTDVKQLCVCIRVWERQQEEELDQTAEINVCLCWTLVTFPLWMSVRSAAFF